MQFACKLSIMVHEARELGLLRTAPFIDKAVNEVGFEIADNYEAAGKKKK